MIQALRKKDMAHGIIAQRETSLAKFIPYCRHLDDTTLKTKDGYLIKIIKVKGLPFETADQSDLNVLKDIRATLLRGLSNSRFALYHHIIRQENHDQIINHFENDFCADLDTSYRAKLKQKRMYSNEQYLTIVRRPAQSKIGIASELSQILLGKLDQAHSKQKEIENLKALNEAVESILKTLNPYRPELLSVYEEKHQAYSKPLSFLSYLINGDQVAVRLPEMSLDHYLPRKRISFGKEAFEIRGPSPEDIKIGTVLSLKEYANATGPGMLDGLLRLPHEFIVTQSFGFVDRQTSLSAMNEAQRKIIASEQGAESLIDDISDAKDDLTSGRSCFGEHHLSITVLGQNKQDLEAALSTCTSTLINLGIVSVREDVNLEPAFWANLPGNFNFIARRSLVSNKNFAGFASMHAFPDGQKHNNHWGNAVTKLETTSGTPYWFNFHERDVGNFVLIGPTGTGKTVLLTFLMAQAQRLKPKCVYFDKDRGAEIFIKALGGDYTLVRPGQPTGLNPLLLPETPENKNFLREWLRYLITSTAKSPLSATEIEIISDAVEANYQTSEDNRRLCVLAELLAGYSSDSANDLARKINRWHSDGDRAWLFDNPQDTLELNNDILGFDLTSILDDPISRAPWLMYIFHRVNDLLDGQRTILMLDEGWKLLDDDVFAARIKDWMKTIRKQNGLIGFATQSVRDAIGSSVGDAIIEQSPTQIFLPNARANEKDYGEGFGLTKHEIKIVRELTPESRCFLLKHGKDSVIARLDLSGMEGFINVLSARSENITIMEEEISSRGDTPNKWLPRFIERTSTS